MTYVLYVPGREEDEAYRNFFANQQGFGFVGTPYQRGAGLGSIFRGLFRAVAPVAKSALRSFGKAALNTGLQVASDALQGRNAGESLAEHGRGAAQGLIDQAQSALQQEGQGLGKAPRKRTQKAIKGPPIIAGDVYYKKRK